MPTVEMVEQILLRAGEWRATKRAGGFRVREIGGGIVVVQWRAPEHDPTSGSIIHFIETYAALLRAAGLAALVLTDAPEPRVLCLPDVVPTDGASSSPR